MIIACSTDPAPDHLEPSSVYEIVALGELAARPNPLWGVFARDINENGEIVGSSRGRAFLWTAQNGMSDLGSLPGGAQSYATAINDAGVVVGETEVGGFDWTKESGMRALASSSGFTSEPHGVNADGFVVGAVASEGLWRAAEWSPDGALRVRDFIGIGNDVNDAGLVAGELHGPGGPYPATWTAASDPSVIPLGQGHTGRAHALNASGAVVGEMTAQDDSSGQSGPTRAFVWTKEAGLRDLGWPAAFAAGEGSVSAQDVNDRLEIVGEASSRTAGFAFIWTPASGLRDLNSLIESRGGPEAPPALTGALAINNRGEIMAYSWTSSGAKAFLLRPMPDAGG
jgi:probable HAF family extracellular repeat protein